MAGNADNQDLKRAAAARALEFARPGMTLGLGTGSTARHFVELLAEKVRNGFRVVCVATSQATQQQAQSLGVPLTTLEETPELDLTVDGADEIDPQLRLIKGGGGALLREKIVAAASRRMIVIADASKVVERLGAFALPVEIVPFGYAATRGHIRRAAARLGMSGALAIRGGDRAPFVTDGGHFILDCAFGSIPQPEALADALASIPGVVDHGLFIGLARTAVIAGRDGVAVMGDLS